MNGRERSVLENSLSSKCGALHPNPIAEVRLQRKPNVRNRVITGAQLPRLFKVSEEVATAHPTA